MLNTERSIQILPQKRTIKTISGQSLLEALLHQNIFLRSDCGGRGKCGKCSVLKILDNGHSEIVESCKYKITDDISIKIPPATMLSSFIMDKADICFPMRFKNQFMNIHLEDSYGVAVDLGTTTIAIYLCNITTGEVLSSIAVKNSQAIYGDDVMNRIGVIGQDGENLRKLQMLVIKSIEWSIKKILSSMGDKPPLVSSMLVVGNPCMIHILAGVDPKPIGVSPYQPEFHDAKLFQTGNLGFDTDDFQIQTLPNVSGFIGGDILAAALAVDLENQPDNTLLIDLGTNGELVLKSSECLYATSCATGPAFEGATLSCGMQAIPGAINSVKINNAHDLSGFSMINPMGDTELKPSGICGAGVINAVAQFCQKQIIAPDGAFHSGKRKYTLVPKNADTSQSSIYISQKDIRSVQLGKSALITGIEFLLKKADLQKPEKIIIAGAFGSHQSKSDLIQLGMIPKINFDHIEMAGNSAGAGAIMALCVESYINKAIEIAKTIEIVDLVSNVEFQDAFIKNLNFSDN